MWIYVMSLCCWLLADAVLFWYKELGFYVQCEREVSECSSFAFRSWEIGATRYLCCWLWWIWVDNYDWVLYLDLTLFDDVDNKKIDDLIEIMPRKYSQNQIDNEEKITLLTKHYCFLPIVHPHPYQTGFLSCGSRSN